MSRSKGLENLSVFGELENWNKKDRTASREEQEEYLKEQREAITKILLTEPSTIKKGSKFYIKAKNMMTGQSQQPTTIESTTPPVEFKVLISETYAEGINDPRVRNIDQTMTAQINRRFSTKEGRKLDYTFVDSTTAIYYEAGTDKFKIDLDSRILKGLKANFKKEFVKLTWKNAYSKMKGKGIKEFDKNKGIYNQHLTREEFLEHEAYRFMFGVEEGLDEKALTQHKGYQTMMKIADKVYNSKEKGGLGFEKALKIWLKDKDKIKQNQARSFVQDGRDYGFVLYGSYFLYMDTRFVFEVAPKK